MDSIIKVTIAGYEVKNIKWNPIANIFVGLVKCPIWGKKELHDGYTPCNWMRNGKPTKKYGGSSRQDLTIIL